MTPQQSPDAALLPTFYRGNARAGDLVRNNGITSNAVQLHQDHVVGNLFKLSDRPNYHYLGISREDARAMAKDVEAAWSEYAEDPHCLIDIERCRTFTMMIREGGGTSSRKPTAAQTTRATSNVVAPTTIKRKPREKGSADLNDLMERDRYRYVCTLTIQ